MKSIWILVLVVLVAGGMVYFGNRSKNEPTGIETGSTTTTETTDSSTDNSSAESPGAYVDYSETVIANTPGTKILFFHAPWCPQCRALEASIKSRTIPTGVTIIKVDYDTNQALRQKYGVTIQTTLVKVDDSGNLIKKYVAYDEPTLETIKENLL